MEHIRLIPVLLLSGRSFVKTTKFKSAKYIGDPVNTVRLFNDLETDELIIIDIEASKARRSPDVSFLRHLASECFMPITYGGGVTGIDQIEKLVACGIEKIAINQALMNNAELLRNASSAFGASTMVAGIDIKRDFFGRLRVYNHVQRRCTDWNPVEYATKLEQEGAGELFINDVDFDGTLQGYNLNAFKAIADQVSIPIVPCGGCNSLANMIQLLMACHITAAAAGSIFVYQGPHNAVLVSYPTSDDKKKLFNEL